MSTYQLKIGENLIKCYKSLVWMQGRFFVDVPFPSGTSQTSLYHSSCLKTKLAKEWAVIGIDFKQYVAFPFFHPVSDTWPGILLGFIKDVGKVHFERGNTFSVLVCIFADKVSWDCRMRSSKNVSNVWKIRNRTRSKSRIPLLDYPSALCGGDISSMYRIKNLME